MVNIELRLLRALMNCFDKIRNELNDAGGTIQPFKNGLQIDEAEKIAHLLGQRVERHPCYVCQKSAVIVMKAFSVGGQDEDAHWYTVCIASGNKVNTKDGTAEYVCRDCLYGRGELRNRLVQELEPTLQRFDRLKPD